MKKHSTVGPSQKHAHIHMLNDFSTARSDETHLISAKLRNRQSPSSRGKEFSTWQNELCDKTYEKNNANHTETKQHNLCNKLENGNVLWTRLYESSSPVEWAIALGWKLHKLQVERHTCTRTSKNRLEHCCEVWYYRLPVERAPTPENYRTVWTSALKKDTK